MEVAGQPQLSFSRERQRARAGQGRTSTLWLQWAQARLEEERGRRESWQRKFMVADVAKWIDRVHESGGNA